MFDDYYVKFLIQFGFSLAWTQAEERQLTLPFLHK